MKEKKPKSPNRKVGQNDQFIVKGTKWLMIIGDDAPAHQ